MKTPKKPTIPTHIRPYLDVDRYDPLVKLAIESKGGPELLREVKRAQEIVEAKRNLCQTRPAKHERCLRRLWQLIGFKLPYGQSAALLSAAVDKHVQRIKDRPAKPKAPDRKRECFRTYHALRAAARVFGLVDDHTQLMVLPIERPSPKEFKLDSRGELPELLEALYTRMNIGRHVKLKAWRPVVLTSSYAELNDHSGETWDQLKARKFDVPLGGKGKWDWRVPTNKANATLLLCCRSFRMSDGESEIHVLDDWARDIADWSLVWGWNQTKQCWVKSKAQYLPSWWRT